MSDEYFKLHIDGLTFRAFVLEGVDKMIYAASLVARIRASANQIQAVAAQLERS